MKKVAVTGLGLLTASGDEIEKVWKHILSGKSFIDTVTGLDLSQLDVKIGGQIKKVSDGGWFDISKYGLKKYDLLSGFVSYGIISSNKAIEDSNLDPINLTEEQKERIAIITASGIGGIDVTESSITSMIKRSPSRVSPFFIPGSLVNTVAGVIAVKNGFKGPTLAATNACASGNNAIGIGMQMIQRDEADIVVATGTEASLCLAGFSGFAAMKALSTAYNDTPTEASRPYDEGHDGFVMSEGSATLILEDYELAKRRGAKIYAEIIGYSSTNDAYHITAPDEQGRGAQRAMKLALDNAKVNASDIDYINLHGTSTKLGDAAELIAVKKVFGEHAAKLSMSSTKSSTGHLLGAAGVLEALFSILSIRDQIVPATINLKNPIEQSQGLNLVPLKPQNKKVKTVMSNAFGFGGCNSCIIIKAP